MPMMRPVPCALLLLMVVLHRKILAWIPQSKIRRTRRPQSSQRRGQQSTSRSALEPLSWSVTPKLLTASRSFSLSVLLASGRNLDDDNATEEDSISELDARVLQSLLRDDSLELQQEQNMKRLLERGIQAKEKVEAPSKTDQYDSEYSSQVIKTLADTKLWKALSRNAKDWVESAKISLQNRLERDARLAAALGIFALDRARQDVARALPATASVLQTKKKPLQLSDTSSYEEPAVEEESKVDLRQEFSTPFDELKAVTAKIQQIFQQADAQTTTKASSTTQQSLASSTSTPATLKSTARRGTARLSQAYARQQQTRLRREKENIAQASGRVASNVIDSAYQVKRELQIEPNRPGYKTKRLREATASTAKLLAAAARASGSFLLKQQQEKERKVLPSSTKNASATTAAKGISTAQGRDATIAKSSSRQGMDATAAAMDAAVYGGSNSNAIDTLFTSAKDAVAAASQSTTKADPVEFLDTEPYFAFKRGPAAPPVKQTISSGSSEEDFQQEMTVDDLLQQQREQQQEQQQRAFETESSAFQEVDSILTAEVVAPTIIAAPTGSIDGIDVRSIDAFEVTDTEALYTGYGYAEDATALEDDDLRNLRQVTAEVISEADFEEVFGQAKLVDNLDEVDGTLEDESKAPNLLAVLTLRSLDIVFLVVEKAVLLIPDILVMTNRVFYRYNEVKREGMGQLGWEPLKSKIRGSKRY